MRGSVTSPFVRNGCVASAASTERVASSGAASRNSGTQAASDAADGGCFSIKVQTAAAVG